MRPNVARRFSDFATNSRAMTSMSMLYSLSVCTCRTARWLSRCWLTELRKYVFRRRTDEKLRSTKKLRGTNTLLVPPTQKLGGTCLPRSPWLLRLCILGKCQAVQSALAYSAVMLSVCITIDCISYTIADFLQLITGLGVSWKTSRPQCFKVLVTDRLKPVALHCCSHNCWPQLLSCAALHRHCKHPCNYTILSLCLSISSQVFVADSDLPLLLTELSLSVSCYSFFTHVQKKFHFLSVALS